MKRSKERKRMRIKELASDVTENGLRLGKAMDRVRVRVTVRVKQ